MKRKVTLLLLLFCIFALHAQGVYKTDKDLSYVSGEETDAYRKERCKLDVYYPVDKKDFPTIVWFHGGGLEGGGKHIPQELMDSRDKIFVSGHSAGGYLSLMLAMDKKYMEAYGADADKVAAYLPLSGQTVTHFTIRKERGLPNGIPVIDEYAPVNRVRKDTPPLILITGDRNLEMADRWEENALLASVLKNIGNKKAALYELQGFNHGPMLEPAINYIRDYCRSMAGQK